LIVLINSQTVIQQPPKEACVGGTVAVDCPAKFVAVVKSAFYGVGQTANLCKYTQGDCLADAMNIVNCNDDQFKCAIYPLRKKLSECRDQYSTYIRIEYDCVPIEMDRATSIYNICQNDTVFTSSNGIIRSPNHPSPFQVTKNECILTLTAPQDKQISLWLTDLYVGSTLSTCTRDHVIVVDDIQSFRFCAKKRFAYPYLCSSSIIIQYRANTSLSIYRGMRMYYEFTDRIPNDGCPAFNGTLTPEPETTTIVTTTTNALISTTLPPYVQLGIASPVVNFQICRGDSQSIECPPNYVITVIRNIFGVSKNGTCDKHDENQNCFTIRDPTTYCRDRCTYFYSGNIPAPNCENKMADYQYVEYQCIPINSPIVSPSTSCPTDGSKVPINIDRKGRFRSYNYPILQTMNCTYRIIAKPNEIINVYSLDISMNTYIPECTSNKLTFVEDGEDAPLDICEQRSYRLIYTSCSNEFDLRYIVGDAAKPLSSGAELYIEAETRPLDWQCGKPLTSSTSATTRTSPLTTSTSPKPLTTSTFDMGASAEMEYDICFGKSLNERCATGYTFMIVNAYYGVKKDSSNVCGFTQGDCVQDAFSTITACQNDQPGCFISYSSKRRLALCSDNYADYLHITGQCVPSSSVSGGSQLTQMGICDSTDDFFAFNGVITSPGFPTYSKTTNECKRTLIGPTESIIKFWINEMSIAAGSARSLSDDESDQPDLIIHKTRDTDDIDELEKMNPALRQVCIDDYLMINSPQIAYVYCGKNKLVIGPFCAGRVTIHYKTTASPLFTYKGFKMYYEWNPEPTDVFCTGPIDPIQTTTPAFEILPSWAQNLELSPPLSTHICLGSSTVLRCYREKDYVLALIDSNYAVTGIGKCDIPSTSHCRQEASLALTCTKSCPISYTIPRPLSACQNQNADYLNIDYECIPTTLPNNELPLDVCSTSVPGTIVRNSGIINSPQYPSLTGVRRCSKTLEALPGKLWMIFMVDLSLESENDFGDCDQSSLTIYDGNEKSIYCGSLPPSLIRISCSNIVQIEFASTHTAIGYRGFKLFYQTVDAPPTWPCVPNFSNATTITTRTTTRAPTTTTLVPPSLQIAAYGGTTTTGVRQYCQFPFVYNGRNESSCLRTDPPVSSGSPDMVQPWCSLTNNFDTDRQWGFCDLGVTGMTMYDICRSQSQVLRCPAGYVVDIVAADYAAKPDGSITADACAYDQNDCFQNDVSTMQNVCAGKPTCTAFHFIRTLANCQNRPSAYLHVHYTCVPNDLPDITTYNLCNSTAVPDTNTPRGYLTSPGFPQTSNNYDCTYTIQTVKPNQDIYLYVLDMDLNSPNLIGQTCSKDRLIIRYDNSEQEYCGRSSTDLVATTCHSSISIQLIRAADAKGRGVKFYFEFRDRSPQVPCPPLITTTTQATLSPTQSTTTSSPSRPQYFPNPSGPLLQKFCYPDVTGLFGANNVQCPQDYVIVINRAFYGKGSRCDYISGDCIVEADNVYRSCSGKRGCSILFLNQVTLAKCNEAVANYLFIEYQCLPTPAIVENSQDLCFAQTDRLADLSGILQSPSYPNYVTSQCNNVTLGSATGSNLVVNMFLLDMNIGISSSSGDPCADEYLLLSYQCNNVWYSQRLCGTRSTELLFGTCSPTDKFSASYSLISQDTSSKRGFSLLYHFVLPLPPITSSTSRLTTQTTTTASLTPTSTLPSGPGAVSTSIEPYSICVLSMRTITCPADYVIILHKVYLATSTSNNCNFSPDHCYEDRTNTYNTICSGKRTCSIFPPRTPIKNCNNSQSTYLYTEHQCIPTRPKLNVDVCSSTQPFERVEGGAIISSLNYTTTFQNCQLQAQSRPLLGTQQHRAFKIFILSLNLPIQRTIREQGAQCSDTNPFIEINDPEQGVTRLCGSSHARFLLETCSNSIDIRFQNFLLNTGTTKFKGFELYVESIENQQCRVEPSTTLPTPLGPLAFRTEAACSLKTGRERVNMYCPTDHGIVILESYQLITLQPNLCDPSRYSCRYPSEQPKSQCSGQQRCSYTYQYPTFSSPIGCSSGRADTVQFTYQCVPMRPVGTYPTIPICGAQAVTADSGFIETPNYPNSYQFGSQSCSIRLPLPADNAVKQYSVYLYVIDVSLRDTTSPSGALECLDSITYTDGITEKQLCGIIDQPILEFRTSRRELNLTMNISALTTPGSGSWRGARLFYVIGNQNIPIIFTTPNPVTVTTATTSNSGMTTSRDIERTTDKSSGPPVSGGAVAGIIIGILLVAVIGVLLFLNRRRFLSTKMGPAQSIVYRPGMDEIDGVTTNGAKEQRTSVSSESLKKVTTLINPNYRKSKAEEDNDVTDA